MKKYRVSHSVSLGVLLVVLVGTASPLCAFPFGAKKTQTDSVKQEASQVRKYIKSGELAKATEALAGLQQRFPDDPVGEQLAQELQLKKYIALQRIKAKLDLVAELIQEDRHDAALQRTKEVKNKETYIPAYYQQEIDTLLNLIEKKEKPPAASPAASGVPHVGRSVDIRRKTAEVNTQLSALADTSFAAQEQKNPGDRQSEPAAVLPEPISNQVPVSVPAEEKRPGLMKKLLSGFETAKKKEKKLETADLTKKKKEEFYLVEDIIRQGNVAEAEEIVQGYATAYPGEYWVSVLQRQLDKKKAEIEKKQAAESAAKEKDQQLTQKRIQQRLSSEERKQRKTQRVSERKDRRAPVTSVTEVPGASVESSPKKDLFAWWPFKKTPDTHSIEDRGQKTDDSKIKTGQKLDSAKITLLKNVRALAAEDKLKEALKLATALKQEYPQDKAVQKTLAYVQTLIQKSEKRKKEYNIWVLEEQVKHSYEDSIEAAEQLIVAGKAQEAQKRLSELPMTFRQRDKRVINLEKRIERLVDSTPSPASDQKDVSSAVAQKRQRPTAIKQNKPDVSTRSELQEREFYVKKLFDEGLYYYQRDMFDDAIRILEVVVKLEKETKEKYTTAALEYIERAQQKKKLTVSR